MTRAPAAQVLGRLTSAGRFVQRHIRWAIDRSRKHWFDAIGAGSYIRRAWAAPQVRDLPARQVYIDVSVICRSDAATGIQRVVRSVAFLLARMEGQGPGWSAPIFVYAHKDRHQVVRLEGERYALTDERVSYAAGDVFVGLDYALDALWRMRGQLLAMRRAGVRFWYVVHDFLPLTHPQWFSAATVLRFRIWLTLLAATAEGFFCVSPPVEQELRAILQSRFGRAEDYRTVVIPMGWDMSAAVPSRGLTLGFDSVLQALRDFPSLLLVGTIEPRKGHADALDAMERLWSAGDQTRLVLVGGVGWKTEDLCARLERHPEAGRRLLLLGKVSDEALELLYARCSGVLVPSLAEGFGLPVVEAIGRGKHVLARDLPVFAQHTGKGVSFFEQTASAGQLAQAVGEWLGGMDRLDPPRPDLLATWSETAAAIATTFGITPPHGQAGSALPPVGEAGAQGSRAANLAFTKKHN
ncbi:glycosyltransferase family 1 protein [Novosphingobium resinovorum]|uniref:glycosyltransferase family 1 protein n=1 Tax=Novosphingobium resinovorum TaxID=158500 RepID=UPI002ED57339|nr:glycosyltransferase family 1 protein [Novosphingobium resinovorum]